MATETHDDIRVNWRVGDFCEAHGISPAKFYREVHAGRLSFIKCGKRTLIPCAVSDSASNR
jgi:hypothetical protein